MKDSFVEMNVPISTFKDLQSKDQLLPALASILHQSYHPFRKNMIIVNDAVNCSKTNRQKSVGAVKEKRMKRAKIWNLR